MQRAVQDRNCLLPISMCDYVVYHRVMKYNSLAFKANSIVMKSRVLKLPAHEYFATRIAHVRGPNLKAKLELMWPAGAVVFRRASQLVRQ